MSENLHLLAGAYALDALPLEERAFYERHLAACEPCRNEVDDYRRTAAALGHAVAETPPPGLRAAVLAAADHTRQISPMPFAPERFSRRFRPVLAPVAAVLVAAVLSLSGVSAWLWQQNERFEAALPDEVTAILDAGGSTAVLDGPEGSARLVYSTERDEGIVVTSGLPQPQEGHDYQLWLFHDGTPVAAGVFHPADDDVATVWVEAPVRGAEGVAVTIEPEGGVEVPTGAVILSADL